MEGGREGASKVAEWEICGHMYKPVFDTQELATPHWVMVQTDVSQLNTYQRYIIGELSTLITGTKDEHT